IGGADPAINPVVRAGIAAPTLQVITEAEITSAEDRRRLPIWGEFYNPYDAPHLCFTTVWREDFVELVLVVCRSARQGTIDTPERTAFAGIARHCRDAAMTAHAIGRDGALVLAGAFQALSA
ncbi:hypothetical protein, partial [Rhodovulum sp. PH10]|uniref:hypothetical protein n=1 Tax=Rhodovulum sp. PH10 TaxID=1187851 RepID=UPI00058DC6D5